MVVSTAVLLATPVVSLSRAIGIKVLNANEQINSHKDFQFSESLFFLNLKILPVRRR